MKRFWETFFLFFSLFALGYSLESENTTDFQNLPVQFGCSLWLDTENVIHEGSKALIVEDICSKTFAIAPNSPPTFIGRRLDLATGNLVRHEVLFFQRGKFNYLEGPLELTSFLSDNFTFYLVFEPSQNPHRKYLFSLQSTQDSDHLFSIFHENELINIQTPDFILSAPLKVPVTRPQILEIIYDSTLNVFNISESQNFLGSFSNSSLNFTDNLFVTIGAQRISSGGSSNGIGTFNWDGLIGDLIFFPRILSDSERLQIIDFLRRRFDIFQNFSFLTLFLPPLVFGLFLGIFAGIISCFYQKWRIISFSNMQLSNSENIKSGHSKLGASTTNAQKDSGTGSSGGSLDLSWKDHCYYWYHEIIYFLAAICSIIPSFIGFEPGLENQTFQGLFLYMFTYHVTKSALFSIFFLGSKRKKKKKTSLLTRNLWIPVVPIFFKMKALKPLIHSESEKFGLARSGLLDFVFVDPMAITASILVFNFLNSRQGQLLFANPLAFFVIPLLLLTLIKGIEEFFLCSLWIFNILKETYNSKFEDILTQTPLPEKEVERIPPDQIILGEELSSGNFGVVIKGTWNRTNVALKSLRGEDLETFLKEARFSFDLRHPHVIQIFGITTIGETCYLVMEFMSQGSLLSFISSHKDLGVLDRLEIINQITDGMVFLSSKRIIHRDLAARNILLYKAEQVLNVKICDFGMSKVIGSGEDHYTATEKKPIPIRWSAPELIERYTASEKSDVWSLGVVIWEIFEDGKHPYSGLTNKEVVQFILKGKRLGRPLKSSKELYSVITACWEEEPKNRPTFLEIANLMDTISEKELQKQQLQSNLKKQNTQFFQFSRTPHLSNYLNSTDELNPQHTYGATPVSEDKSYIKNSILYEGTTDVDLTVLHEEEKGKEEDTTEEEKNQKKEKKEKKSKKDKKLKKVNKKKED